MKRRRIGDVEIRYYPEDVVDEVLLDKDGQSLFHLEHMDDGHVWMRVGNIHVNLVSDQPIRASITLDDGEGPEPKVEDYPLEDL